MVPVDRYSRLAQPLFQHVLKDILRQDHHEGKRSAELGQLHFGLARGAVVERDLLDAPPALDDRRRQPHPVQQLERARVQGAGITARRRAFLAVNDPYLDARLGQQDGGQQPHRPRPNHQDFRSFFSHTVPSSVLCLSVMWPEPYAAPGEKSCRICASAMDLVAKAIARPLKSSRAARMALWTQAARPAGRPLAGRRHAARAAVLRPQPAGAALHPAPAPRRRRPRHRSSRRIACGSQAVCRKERGLAGAAASAASPAAAPARRPGRWERKSSFAANACGWSPATNGEAGLIRFGGEAVPVADATGDLRPAIERHLRQLAAQELPARVFELAALHQLPVRRVTVRNQRSRWGSCSRRGTISLNWRLVQTPLFVRDYLVLHELAHLKEMNHSRRFWSEVARPLPGFPRGGTLAQAALQPAGVS